MRPTKRMKMNDLIAKDVLKVIVNIAQSIRHHGLMLNERYLHHFFSHQLQEMYDLLDLTREGDVINLHPEWPTYKTQTGLLYSRYKNEDGEYRLNLNGKAGYIDFAIGNYEKPDIGIEFTLKYGWAQEEIVYDFLKLLDRRNPFTTSISFNVIFRQIRLTKGGNLRNFEEHMNDAIEEVNKRLGNGEFDGSRELHLIVTEIDKDNNRRHWHYDKASSRFENGLPLIG